VQQADAALRTQHTVTHGIASNHHGALSHCFVLRTSHLHRDVLQGHSTHSFFGEAEAEAVGDGGGVTLLILEVINGTSSSLTIRAIAAIDVVRTLTTGNSSLVVQTNIGLTSGIAVDTQVVAGQQAEASHRSNTVATDGAVRTAATVEVSVDGTVAVQHVVVSTRAQDASTAFLRSILLVQSLASLEQVLNDQIATSVTVSSSVQVDTREGGTTRHTVQGEQALANSEGGRSTSTNRTQGVDTEGCCTVGRSSGDHTVSTGILTVNNLTNCPESKLTSSEVSAQGDNVGSSGDESTASEFGSYGTPNPSRDRQTQQQSEGCEPDAGHKP
jgi:hypothetical protein